MAGKRGSRWFDRAIRWLASRQHGVVARWQLEDLGLTPDQIDDRIASGFFAPMHRGVYAVGHDALKPEGRWTAALLAVGDGAVLSHRSAGAIWGFSDDGPIPDVTVPRSSKRDDIATHRAAVPDDERQALRGLAVTTPSRTLLDLAAVLPLTQLERAHREAHVLGLPLDLESLLCRHPGRRGVRKLRILLGEPVPKSSLEQRFRRFLKKHALPLPDAGNVEMPWGEADCVWWKLRLAVELDGHSTHRTRAQFERDRARDRQAAAAGWMVVRVTWLQLRHEPAAVASDLSQIIRARSALAGK